jgi:hypothetical protein
MLTFHFFFYEHMASLSQSLKGKQSHRTRAGQTPSFLGQYFARVLPVSFLMSSTKGEQNQNLRRLLQADQWLRRRQSLSITWLVFLHCQRQSFPLAFPPATQSIVGWKCATAGTAVMPSPSSCASCTPLASNTSTKRFILPITNF